MELDYSGANDLESRKAIRKAYLDHIRNRLIETGARPLTRDEFLRQISAAMEANKLKKKQREDGKDDEASSPT